MADYKIEVVERPTGGGEVKRYEYDEKSFREYCVKRSPDYDWDQPIHDVAELSGELLSNSRQTTTVYVDGR